MKFIQTHSMGGDCTAPYDIEDYHKIVADFVGEVLGYKREWGDIIIDGCKFEYKHGELLDLIPSTILSKRIVNVKAVGGWTWMRYEIETSTPPPRAAFIFKNPFKP